MKRPPQLRPMCATLYRGKDGFIFLPKIARQQIKVILAPSLVGALISGAYGVIHDQITYTISPEYFTEFKFHQFKYAILFSDDRLNAALIGFLATFWVGLACGWFIGRWHLKGVNPKNIVIKIYQSYIIVAMAVVLLGLIGYLFGNWAQKFAVLGGVQVNDIYIQDAASFLRVACIHYFSYFGALVGVLIALFVIKREK